MQFLSDYGLFLVELLTVAAVVLGAVGVALALARRGADAESLQIEHLNKRFEGMTDSVRHAVEGKRGYRKTLKARKKSAKAAERSKSGDAGRKRIYVIDFKGDVRASATASLREEISALLSLVRPEDQVLVRLENAGGTVHEHGLAASQLMRVRQRGVRLLVAVDKVAASGGYLMACVADHIMAAPFAIIGSIGVIAQLPNFHRLLEEKGIDFEQIYAGRYKRTLTLFGENTEEGRSKLKLELEDVHELFQQQIAEHRPQVELARVATGEHWYGLRALTLNLIDEIRTSDDFLMEAQKEHDLYRVVYKRRRSLPERLMGGVESAVRQEFHLNQ
jgi:serine protease SohB